MSLSAFLNRFSAFGAWDDVWSGVPLTFRAALADATPPREYVGSVRAVLLRGDQVLAELKSPPILSVGGRGNAGETIEQTLHREVGEECGWHVRPIGVIGFVHARHIDHQRPNWGRPAPDFLDPIFAVEAIRFDEALKGADESKTALVPIADLDRLGVEAINRTFLQAALGAREKADVGSLDRGW